MSICDYKGYDYKTEFWDKVDRRYEDSIERKMIQKLLKKAGAPFTKLMDAGCGFGRLFSSYEGLGDQFVLLDFAQHLLDQASATIKSSKPIQFVQGNLVQMPVASQSVDAVLSIRTLHHVEEPAAFFKEVHRVLKKDGYFVFEIPNKRHVLNILKFILGKLSFNPFSFEKATLNKVYFNFHPKPVLQALAKAGFACEQTVSLSFFRSTTLKKWISPALLIEADAVLQRLFSWVWMTPSVYVLAKKI